MRKERKGRNREEEVGGNRREEERRLNREEEGRRKIKLKRGGSIREAQGRGGKCEEKWGRE